MLMFVAGSKFNSQVHHFFSLTNEWRQRWIRIFVSKSLKNIKVAIRRDFFATKKVFRTSEEVQNYHPMKNRFNYIEKLWKYHRLDEKTIFVTKARISLEKQEVFSPPRKMICSTVRKINKCQLKYLWKNIPISIRSKCHLKVVMAIFQYCKLNFS